jgi:hypothetical protein
MLLTGKVSIGKVLIGKVSFGWVAMLTAGAAAAALALALVALGCATSDSDNKKSGGSTPSGKCKIKPTISISTCDPASVTFSTTIDNPYFPLLPGSVSTLDGEEDGVSLHLVIEVTTDTEDMNGVTTRVVNETVTSGDKMVEFAVNYFAQAGNGAVCYFGEAVDNYVKGKVDNHDGSWRADENGNQPGIVMPASPAKGDAFSQESAPGVAVDRAEITSLGDELVTPLDTYTTTLTTSECSPLEDNSYETKVYVKGIGVAYDNGLKLTAVETP